MKVLRTRPGLVSTAALALVLLGPPSASAGPTERLRDLFTAVNAILADPETEDKPLERVSRIRLLVAEVSDVNAAAAKALGGEWRARGPGEQEEFVAVFAELLERAYVGRLAGRARVSDGVRIAYLGESVAGDEASVQTSLGARDGGQALIEYRMVNRHGQWRVRDLVLDGVSTVENYRAQFRRILRTLSFQDLVGQVRAKLSEASVIFARIERRRAPAPEPLPLELVQLAPLGDAAIDGDQQPPGVPAAATVRSREIGWIVAAPAAAYWVQVGAFETAAAAWRLAERLSGGTVVASASGRLLLVRVGPFAQHAQAVSKLRELEALGYQPFIAQARD